MARNLPPAPDRVKTNKAQDILPQYSHCREPPDKIAAMNTVILILLAITLAAVVIVLLSGVIGMARGGDFNAKYGNKLMRLRVILQGLAVVLFLLLVLTANRG